MFDKKGNFWMSVVGTLVVVVAVLGIGYLVYQAGFNQGAISEGVGGMHMFDNDSRYFGKFGHMGSGSFFGFGGLFLGILFFFLLLGAIRWLFFIPAWGMLGRPGMRRWMDEGEDPIDSDA